MPKPITPGVVITYDLMQSTFSAFTNLSNISEAYASRHVEIVKLMKELNPEDKLIHEALKNLVLNIKKEFDFVIEDKKKLLSEEIRIYKEGKKNIKQLASIDEQIVSILNSYQEAKAAKEKRTKDIEDVKMYKTLVNSNDAKINEYSRYNFEQHPSVAISRLLKIKQLLDTSLNISERKKIITDFTSPGIDPEFQRLAIQQTILLDDRNKLSSEIKTLKRSLKYLNGEDNQIEKRKIIIQQLNKLNNKLENILNKISSINEKKEVYNVEDLDVDTIDEIIVFYKSLPANDKDACAEIVHTEKSKLIGNKEHILEKIKKTLKRLEEPFDQFETIIKKHSDINNKRKRLEKRNKHLNEKRNYITTMVVLYDDLIEKFKEILNSIDDSAETFTTQIENLNKIKDTTDCLRKDIVNYVELTSSLKKKKVGGPSTTREEEQLTFNKELLYTVNQIKLIIEDVKTEKSLDLDKLIDKLNKYRLQIVSETDKSQLDLNIEKDIEDIDKTLIKKKDQKEEEIKATIVACKNTKVINFESILSRIELIIHDYQEECKELEKVKEKLIKKSSIAKSREQGQYKKILHEKSTEVQSAINIIKHSLIDAGKKEDLYSKLTLRYNALSETLSRKIEELEREIKISDVPNKRALQVELKNISRAEEISRIKLEVLGELKDKCEEDLILSLRKVVKGKKLTDSLIKKVMNNKRFATTIEQIMKIRTKLE